MSSLSSSIDASNAPASFNSVPNPGSRRPLSLLYAVQFGEIGQRLLTLIAPFAYVLQVS